MYECEIQLTSIYVSCYQNSTPTTKSFDVTSKLSTWKLMFKSTDIDREVRGK